MKKILRPVCIILIFALLLSVPVFAEEESSAWASSYFIAYSTYLYRTTGTQFQVWFDVSARSIMNELGVNSIKVQRSSDGENWTTVKTYLPEDYPQMLCESTGSHTGYVTYTGTSGYDYRAYVTFYAMNDTGIGKRFVYAYFL